MLPTINLTLIRSKCNHSQQSKITKQFCCFKFCNSAAYRSSSTTTASPFQRQAVTIAEDDGHYGIWRHLRSPSALTKSDPGTRQPLPALIWSAMHRPTFPGPAKRFPGWRRSINDMRAFSTDDVVRFLTDRLNDFRPPGAGHFWKARLPKGGSFLASAEDAHGEDHLTVSPKTGLVATSMPIGRFTRNRNMNGTTPHTAPTTVCRRPSRPRLPHPGPAVAAG